MVNAHIPVSGVDIAEHRADSSHRPRMRRRDKRKGREDDFTLHAQHTQQNSQRGGAAATSRRRCSTPSFFSRQRSNSTASGPVTSWQTFWRTKPGSRWRSKVRRSPTPWLVNMQRLVEAGAPPETKMGAGLFRCHVPLVGSTSPNPLLSANQIHIAELTHHLGTSCFHRGGLRRSRFALEPPHRRRINRRSVRIRCDRRPFVAPPAATPGSSVLPDQKGGRVQLCRASW